MEESENRVLLNKPTISDLLASAYRNCRFVLGGEELSAVELFSAVGFLPPIVHEADARSSRIFGFSLKIIMSESRHALFGHRAHVGVNDWRFGVACILATQVTEEMLGVPLVEAANAQTPLRLDVTPIYTFFNEGGAASGSRMVPVAERVPN